MKLIGLDVGTVRIGVATSDIMQILATPYETYKRRTPYLDARYIVELAEKLNAEKLIFGLPLKLDGTEGDRVEVVRAFAALLAEYTDIPIDFYDERMSTMVAYRFLGETGTFGKKRKDAVDTLSAEIILQGYLDREKTQKV